MRKQEIEDDNIETILLDDKACNPIWAMAGLAQDIAKQIHHIGFVFRTRTMSCMSSVPLAERANSSKGHSHAAGAVPFYEGT
jgi:hypothetical protein